MRIIEQYDLRRELILLRFDKKYIENIIKTFKERGKYDDKYITIQKLYDNFVLYELK